MNTSIELDLQSIILDALSLESDFLHNRANPKTGAIINRNGFKSAGSGFTFSYSRPLMIPIPDTLDDAKVSMMNIEVGLPTPENKFEYSIRITFPVTCQVDEDIHGKCGILNVITNRVSFVPYMRCVYIRNNDVDDDYAQIPDVEGELVQTHQDRVCLVVNKRGMTFNPRILEEITIVFKDDDIDWKDLKLSAKEQA